MARYYKYTLSTAEQTTVGAQTFGAQHGCIIQRISDSVNKRANFFAVDVSTIKVVLPPDFDESFFRAGEQYSITSNFFGVRNKALVDTWTITKDNKGSARPIIKDDASITYDASAAGAPTEDAAVKQASNRRKPESGESSTRTSDSDESSGSSSGRGDQKAAQATEPADSPVTKATLDGQAQALTNTYAQARLRADQPAEGVDPQFTAAMKYVLDSEISAKPTGEAWTAAHSQALREAAGLLLGNVSNPELQIFVRSYDAAMAVDITAKNSGERFGITRTGAKALSAFVNANKDTAPQRGDAQYFLKDANNNDLKLVQQDPKSVLASAWALIFALRVRFRRGEVLGSIAASPSMRYPWPAERDTRNFSDSPAKDASVGPRLTLRVWTQADRDDKFDLGKSAVVLTFEADSSSFAKQIKELPSILRLRTATRSREEAVRGKK